MQKESSIENACDGKQLDRELLKKTLTPLQYRVTQHKITERPFTGEYVKLNDNGMYSCVVCGEQLFSSQSKYDSGCGWPAFNDVTDNNKIKLTADMSHVGSNLLLLALRNDVVRTEVSCAKCNAHLGHLFDDGPKPTGKRFCINSASLKFYGTNSKQPSIKSDDNLINNSYNAITINGTNQISPNVKSNFCGHNNGTTGTNGTKRTLMETHL